MCWKTYSAAICFLNDCVKDLVPLCCGTWIGWKLGSPNTVETCIIHSGTSWSYTDMTLSRNPKCSITSVGFVFPSFPTTHSGSTPRARALCLGALWETGLPSVQQTWVCRNNTATLPLIISIFSVSDRQYAKMWTKYEPAQPRAYWWDPPVSCDFPQFCANPAWHRTTVRTMRKNEETCSK